MQIIAKKIILLMLMLRITSAVVAQSDEIQDLAPYVVRPGTVANETPVLTYANPISLLNFGPLVDVQSRNFSEAQGDISIRGGIFENTGFTVGSINVFDPQTGHYVAELPIDPIMLEQPNVLTGHENAVATFNATAGSVQFGWKPISINQRQVRVSFGENGLNTQSVYVANKFSSNENSGIDFGLSRSESDGSIPFGDHDFKRASIRYGFHNSTSQLILFGGYQDKFFGWPNMYTPYGVQETEDIQTLLLMAEYIKETTSHSQLTLSAYYRKNQDDYEFDRDRPGLYNPYEHETQVSAIHGEYKANPSDTTEYYVSGDLFFDTIESTTLTHSFQSRTYSKIQTGANFQDLIGEFDISTNLAFFDTNRDTSMLNPSIRIEHDLSVAEASESKTWYFEYTKNTQVAGYTAIGSSPRGLFAGNQNLGIEKSHNFELGWEYTKSNLYLQIAAFFRMDRDLTDWTYSFEKQNARSANAVDIDTLGVETQLVLQSKKSLLSIGYVFLKKQEDYNLADVDASFYALNYPNHRVTLSLRYQLLENLEVRLDNEYRIQEKNSLRSSDDQAFLTYASIVYRPLKNAHWELAASVENLWDESFQEVPAVPSAPRQFSIQSSLSW